MPKSLRPFVVILLAGSIVGLSAGLFAADKNVQSTILACILFVAVVVWIYWRNVRASRILNRWAKQNGYRIFNREYRSLFRGRFWWRTSKSQRVYYVDVIDAEGNHRTGYVRIGNWFLGMLIDEVSVEWDRPYALNGPDGFPVIQSTEKNIHGH